MNLLKCACFYTLIMIFFSCSLDYNKSAAYFDKRPNLVFKNITLEKYEDKKMTMKINSERLEMYETEKIWAGRNLKFVQFAKKGGKNEFSGSAGAALIDNGKDEYFLGNNVEFKSEEDSLTISSAALFWMKKENMLFAPEDKVVSIQKSGEVTLSGLGFAANTAAKTFEISSGVKGIIETDKTDKDGKSVIKNEDVLNPSYFNLLNLRESASRSFRESGSGGNKSE